MTQQYQEVGDDYLSQRFGAPGSQSSAAVTTTQLAPLTQTDLAPVVEPKKKEKGPVAPPATMPETEKPNLKGMAESVLSTQKKMQERPAAEAQNPLDPILDYATQNWQYFAIPAAAVAANYVTKTVSPSRRSLVDRMFSTMAPDSTIASPQVTNRIDPVMDTGSSLQKPDLDMSKLDPQMREIIARSEANRVSKEKDLEFRRQQRQQAAVNEINRVPDTTGMPTLKAPSPIPDVIQKTMVPMTPVLAPAPNMVGSVAPVLAPEVPTVADIGKQAVGVAPIEPPSTTTQIATEATQKKSTGRPKGSVGLKDTPETWQKLTKEGVVFLPGYGPGDNSLYNTYGAEGRKAILEKYNQGKPLGSDENYKELNKKLRLGVPPSEVPELMARLPSAEEAGNYGKLGKQMKVGGVLGLGLLASQLANAKSNTEAKQVLGEALLPLGLTPSTLQSGVLPPEIVQQMMAERQKLGSPFRGVAPPQ